MIIVLTGRADSGGAAVAIGRLIPLWAGEGHRLTVLASGEADWLSAATTVVDLGPPPSRTGAEGSLLLLIRAVPAVIRTLRRIRRVARDQPDEVVLAFLTGTALVTLVATIGLPSRVVVCERNDPSREPHGWHVQLLKRLLYPRAAAITVNTLRTEAVEHLRRVSRGRPVHFVPNPHPADSPRAEPATSRTILAVGRLVPQKRHAVLIDAFAQVHDELPGWSIQIVGEGPLREDLGRQIERLNLSPRVKLCGQINDLRPFYAAAGIFVLPSAHEGTSNALLEAAASGLPCIVTDTAVPLDLADVIVSVPPGDTDALSGALRRLCTNPTIRMALGDALHVRSQRLTTPEISEAWNAAFAAVPT